ncbi:MAG: hypothetical protein KZQ86_02160, partial [Candidatus Thiodiazotropha sp. (ex Lucinoma kastoroae)]|nr:hypothetical protein [Candidatus Thiodiazotropha sp. (ex Lucinoma kastoroae)]
MTDSKLNGAINTLCERYRIDNNPLHLWTVYRLCRSHNADFPEEVLEYFDTVSRNFHYLMSRTENVDWPEVGEAMLLTTGKGAGNKFSSLQTQSKLFGIAFDYYVFKNDGMKSTALIKMLCENFSVSESTVKSARRKYKGSLQG